MVVTMQELLGLRYQTSAASCTKAALEPTLDHSSREDILRLVMCPLSTNQKG
jgi:hypothetical protein